jgi:hypothetical protein
VKKQRRGGSGRVVGNSRTLCFSFLLFFFFFFLKGKDMKDMKYLDIYQNHLDILPRVADEITKNAADPILVAKVHINKYQKKYYYYILI